MYQQLVEILGNVKENNALTELDVIKLLFKKIIFGDSQIPAMKELWFEREEIRADEEYYQLIISLISVFIMHFSDKKSFDEKLLAKEIFSVFQNTKYFCLYINLIEISKLFDLGEQYYIEISCGLYILGNKKGTPANEYLIEKLKDFTQEKIIKDSMFYTKIKTINYETINENFMKNLLLLYNLIISKEDAEKIKCQIKMLENSEEYKDQRLSSVSTNFENIDNEERKLNGEAKNSENTSPIKEEENPEKIKENEKKNKGDNSLIKKEKKSLEKINITMDQKAVEINNKDVNYNTDVKNSKIEDEKIVVKNIEFVSKDTSMKNNEVQNENRNEINNEDNKRKIDKNNKDMNENSFEKNKEVTFDKKLKNVKEEISCEEKSEENNKKKKEVNDINSLQPLEIKNIIQEKEDKKNDIESVSVKLNKNEFHDLPNNNEKQIYSNYSLDELHEFIKKKFEKSIDENDKDKNTIVKLIMPIFQRHNRYYGILRQLFISKSTIKEIENFHISQKKMFEEKIEIEKCLIEINRMKSITESLKIPSIIIVKRKILDLIIFSLIKKNKDKFELCKNYCPNASFLGKIMAKLENYSKNILRKDEEEKVKKHKENINELIKKNDTTIEFPFSCSDNNLDKIIWYLGFCKSKYNKIVHISKEALKYYLYLSFNDRIEPKFKELLNLFIVYGENKDNVEKSNTDLNTQNKLEEEEKENGKEENEKDSLYERPLKIKFDTALDFFLKDNFGIEDVSSKLEKKLEEIESKKNLILDKYDDYVSEGWKKLLIIYDIFDNKENKNNMNIFYPNEKELINDITKDFEDTLKLLEASLLELKEVKDGITIKELINQFFSKYHQITQKELKFDNDYYLNLCETAEGRYLLIFFQIQLTKYCLLDSYSKKFAKILNDFYEINKNSIMTEIIELKNQSRKLVDEIKKINSIKSPKKMFFDWKFNNGLIIKEDFESFINGIKSYVGSVELKFNDDLISDQATSLWLIKNELDQYVD